MIIGSAYLKGHGWGNEPNIERAVAWLRRSAELDNIDAMVALAPILRNGSKSGDTHSQRGVVCCSVLQSVAVCCSVCCGALQCGLDNMDANGGPCAYFPQRPEIR